VLARGDINDLAGRNFIDISSEIAYLGGGGCGERQFKNVTAFQYAVWALDVSMWRMLRSYLDQFPGEIQAQAKPFLLDEPGLTRHGRSANHYFQRLINALETYIGMMSIAYGYDEDHYKHHWIQTVGAAQLLLPMHALNEYCHPTRSFEPCPDFNQQIPLLRSRKISLDEDHADILSSTWDKGGLGSKFASLRHSLECAAGERKLVPVPVPSMSVENSGNCSAHRIWGWQGGMGYYQQDLNAITALFKARIQQRDQLIDDLFNSNNLEETRYIVGFQ
jgi:hypothetical protein